jgi:hypothetical protein
LRGRLPPTRNQISAANPGKNVHDGNDCEPISRGRDDIRREDGHFRFIAWHSIRVVRLLYLRNAGAILAAQFFSGVNPTAAFIFTLLAFAAGFAVRPFGALFFRSGSATSSAASTPSSSPCR